MHIYTYVAVNRRQTIDILIEIISKKSKRLFISISDLNIIAQQMISVIGFNISNA